MSTDHQKYSTQNQSDTIRQYAAQRGIQVVRTYADEGKSGLTLDRRDALQRLIADVQNKTADFTVILVYDVSRWGRFQDTDESAYYEFICRRAGISVHYCAEQFENDNTPASTIMKNMKRWMAGEYSRDLSVKVFAGQRRLVELGFHLGGRPGYGLRRLLVDQSGTLKAELKPRERKSIQTDRVILTLGPAQEVETVRWIFRSFVDCGSEKKISRTLNQRRILTDLGGPWNCSKVHRVLMNERYIGANVWNHSTSRLKTKSRRNSRDRWIRADSAIEPIVKRSLFDAAQAIIAKRRYRVTNEQMLAGLQRLLQDRGHVTGPMIDETEYLPCQSLYKLRFGGLTGAYERLGFTWPCDYRYVEANRGLRRMQKQIVTQAIAVIEKAGGLVEQDPATGLLTINDEITAFILMVRCRKIRRRSLRWLVRLDVDPRPDILVAVRMNETNSEPLDYYLLPPRAMVAPILRLAQNNGLPLDAYRCETLEPFFSLVARHQPKSSAKNMSRRMRSWKIPKSRPRS
jgi:DNA invertase Pin-like site-specific DNA recombinase